MSSKKKASKQHKQQSKESEQATTARYPLSYYLIFLFMITVFIIRDVQREECYKGTPVGNFFRDYHVCEYSQKVLNTTSEGIKWINSEIDKQFPGYEKKIQETLEPYSELLSDLGFVACKMASNAKESVVNKIEEYAPGLLDKTRNGIKSALLEISNFIKKSVKYLKEEVFIGDLAPEHIGKVMLDLLHLVQQKLNEFYVWGYEKVRTVIK